MPKAAGLVEVTDPDVAEIAASRLGTVEPSSLALHGENQCPTP
jgi:hypothetical protein